MLDAAGPVWLRHLVVAVGRSRPSEVMGPAAPKPKHGRGAGAPLFSDEGASASTRRPAAPAMLTVHDLDATAEEIRWAATSGMKGVIIPTAAAGRPTTATTASRAC